MAEGALEETAVPDCLSIAKHFERGATYSVTEESVFAMMTPLLSTSRIHSRGIINQIETQEALTALQSSEQKIQTNANSMVAGVSTTASANLNNLDKSDEKDENIFSRVKGNFFPGQGGGNVAAGAGVVNSEIFGNVFNSKCIPCGDRLNLAGELNFKVGLKNYFEYWKEWLKRHLQMLQDLLKMFLGAGGFIDLCALIAFLKDFICVPDLARILSALMALMANMNFDISGVFDLILQLAAPLLQPFLSNFVDMLQRYILLIIAPLECIIASIQSILSKLDYNILFQNIDQLDKHVGFGRQSGKKTGQVKILAPVLGVFGVDSDLHDGPRKHEFSFNPLDAATGGAIKRENETNRRASEEARDELTRVQAGASNVDSTDPAAVARYNDQVEQARENYRDAKDKQDLSAIGRMNKGITDFTNKFRSSLLSLIGALREAAERVEAFFKDIFDELKKLMGEYFGGGGSLIQLLSEKLVIVQLISLVSQIIKLFTSDLHCDDDKKDIKIERIIPAQANMSVWTDDEGRLHIEEDPEVIRRSVDETVKALGQRPVNLAPGSGNAKNAAQADKGQSPSEQTPRQKLQSLIEFTGDPVLDSSIARTTEALTTPINVVFKCPLQTTVQDAEQVNTWIRELNGA